MDVGKYISGTGIWPLVIGAMVDTDNDPIPQPHYTTPAVTSSPLRVCTQALFL